MKRNLALAVAALCLQFGLIVLGAPPAAAATVFTVNSTADSPDAVLDGICQTSVAGQCTLRAAITEAREITSEHVTIGFDIPGAGVKTILVNTALPQINNGTAGITIDGFTQPGSSPNTDPLVDNAVRLIDIVGKGYQFHEGFVVLGSNNVFRGLVMRKFIREIRFTGPDAKFNEVVGNVLGLQPDGTLDPTYANVVGAPCILINGGANQNRIGKPGSENRNVISGCYEKGVTLHDAFTWKNYVQNNLLGLDPTGTLGRPSLFGVDINWSANGTIVGGLGFQERNVVSGNVHSGIEISHGTGTINNSVVGNYIGTDPTGNSAAAHTANKIGVRIEGFPDCGTSPCPSDISNATVTDNVIVNSTWGGILVDKGAHSSTIARNLIGVTLNGTVVGNNLFAIRLSSGARSNTVADNTIAGTTTGIQVTPFSIDPLGTTPTNTRYNRFTNNSVQIYNGTGGIDLYPYDVTNSAGSADPNVQEAVLPPVLSMQSGSVRATTCAGCTVELMTAGRPAGVVGPGILRLATQVAGSDGRATFAPPPEGWPASLTATTTTTAGSTSEFALNIDPTSSTVAPPGVPGNVSAVGGNASASVSFTAPTTGDPVEQYTVHATDLTNPANGGQTATGVGSPITVTGLTNADQYQFTVSATNAGGTSAESSPSNPVTLSSVTITNASPSVLGQDAFWRQVNVNGTGFAAGTTVSFGEGVQVKQLTLTSATQLTTKLSVDVAAPIGPRDVVVTAADGSVATCTACFNVAIKPTITQVTPNFWQSGTAPTVDIVGSDFDSAPVVTVDGTGVTLGPVTRVDSTLLRVTATVASNSSPVGARLLTVRNANAGRAFSPISISPPQPPQPPTGVTAAAGNGSATVTFTPPTAGDPPTGYVVRATDLTTPANGGQSVTGSGSPLVVPGLTNGDLYTFTVSSTNTSGEGAASAPSEAVRPTSITVDHLTPSEIGQGSLPVTVGVFGTGFSGTMTVAAGDGVQVNSVTPVSAGQFDVSFTVAPTAAVGPRALTVTAPDGSVVDCTGCLVIAAAPQITAAAPDSWVQSTSRDVEIAGDGFVAGASVSIDGTGVTFGPVDVQSANLIRVPVTVANDAPTGSRTVTVANTNGGRGSVQVAIDALAPPGAPTEVMATSQNQSASVSFDPPIGGQDVPITLYTVRATDATAPERGGQTVTGTSSPIVVPGLTNGDEYTFTVSASNAAGEGPESVPSNVIVPAHGVSLTSVAPAAIGRGAEEVPVAFSGTGFVAGTTLDLGTGVTVSDIQVVSETSLTALVSVNDLADLGAHDVEVTTAAGSATCTGCLTVNPAPAVNAVDPEDWVQGTSFTVTIDGAGFSGAPTVSVSGVGVSVGGVVPQSPTSLQVSITVAGDAPVGSRTLTVRNEDFGTAHLPVNIEAPPLQVPGVPTGVTAVAGNASATVTFLPPTTGGAPTSYTVLAEDLTAPERGGQTATGETSPIAVAGLTNGDQYQFTVTASNSAGPGPASAASNVVIPSAGPTVTVTSATPAVLGQDAFWREIKVYGTGFGAGTTVSFGAGVQVKSLVVASATQLTTKLSVDPAASIGPRDVIVTTPSGSATCAGCFSVAVAPSISGVTPGAWAPGSSVTVDIAGANFDNYPVVTIDGTGVTFGTVSRLSDVLLRVQATVGATAPTGSRTLTVRNGNAGRAYAPVTIGAVAPQPPGAPTGVSAVAGDTSATVTFSPPGSGAPTLYTVRAEDMTAPERGGQVLTGPASPITITGLTNGDQYRFTVSATNGAGEGPQSSPSNVVTPTGGPTVTSAAPSVLGQDAFWRQVKVYGTGFGAGTTVSFGAGVQVKSLAVTSATQLTTQLSVDAAAAIGPRDVIVTTASGSATCAGCFSVAVAPSISGVTPNSWTRGGPAITVEVAGANFDNYPVITVDGTGVTIGTLTRVSSALLRVLVTVASTAPTGSRTLTVRNGNAGRAFAPVTIT